MARRTSGGKAYPLFRPSARNFALALGVASGTVLSAGAAYLLGAIVDGLASGEDVSRGCNSGRLCHFLRGLGAQTAHRIQSHPAFGRNALMGASQMWPQGDDRACPIPRPRK